VTLARVGAAAKAHAKYNRSAMLVTLRRLFGRRRVPRNEMKPQERSPDELERERDLLERVAAGIALDKTPGR
jgi:hypothetical protein